MNDQHRLADVTVGSTNCGPLRSDPASRLPLSQPLVLGLVWIALVALAVAGRAWQPAAHVTPLAAVSLAAGAFFPGTLLAVSVPVMSLAIGNLFLPPYGSLLEAVVIYAAFAWPVLLGRAGLLGSIGRETRWLALIGGGLASSLVFYFATNITFWLTTDMYPRSAAGLLACLTAALPFHRWMPVGDLAWTLGIFGVFQAATTASDAFAARRLAPRRSS
ncbi:MAG: hypothetical protein O3A18_11455 [Planctomycetota bacterium]|jgi:hypothetical protein|nr:hypothetical protein [Planctomycetota bacterium]